jgi:hypothetical protein
MSSGVPFRWIRDCANWLSHPYKEYDRRRDVRFPAEVAVTINVPLGVVDGRSLNLSKGGVSVLLPEALTCGSVVLIRFPMLDRSAFAYVRRCVAREDKCEVALQFRDGLMLDDRTMADFDYHRVSAAGTWNDPLA